MGIAAVLVVIILAAATFAGLYLTNQNQSTQSTQTFQVTTYQTSKIPVVAAENFWGSLVSQLGSSQDSSAEHSFRSQCRPT